VFVLERPAGADAPVCYMFEGFMTGAFRFLLEDSENRIETHARESQCAARGHDHCRFEFGA
jgi:predicted hydrocarbon binding protein